MPSAMTRVCLRLCAFPRAAGDQGVVLSPTSSARPGPYDASVTRPGGADWWRSAVVYEVYPRSFSDHDGDGTGDILGIIDRLPYLAQLGINAIWVSPWYPSPMADGGYDVSDYRDIHPDFGTLKQADAFVAPPMTTACGC
jgi:alpha-glucosidase